MSRAYRVTPGTTFFDNISRRWYGTGIVLQFLPNDTVATGTSSELSATFGELHVTVVKLRLGIPDPGTAAATGTDLDMTELFHNGNLLDKMITVASALASNAIRKVIIAVDIPQSWLDVNESLTGEDRIMSYVRLVTACLQFLKEPFTATPVTHVELCPFPDLFPGHVSPMNLVLVASRLKAAIAQSSATVPVSVIGPGLSSAMPLDSRTEPYTDAFVNAPNVLSTFTVAAEVPSWDADADATADGNDETNGTDGQMELLYRCLQANAAQMEAIGWQRERFATSFGKDVRPIGADEHAHVRTALRAFCATVKAGFSSIMYHRLSTSASVDPVLPAYSRLGELIPSSGSLYASEEMTEGDDTLKAMVLSTSGNHFCFLLCRPPVPDALLGSLRLVIRNPLFSNRYAVTGLTITAFPEVDTAAVQTKSLVTTGEAMIFLKDLPYGSHTFVLTGTVQLNPPLNPPPSPPPAESEDGTYFLPETIIQVPVYFGEPATANRALGTFYYDAQDNSAKVLMSGAWQPIIPLSRPTAVVDNGDDE